MSTRMKAGDVADVRAEILAQQRGHCMLCCFSVHADEAVLDHDHATGRVRGVLHRGCNAMLGKLENGRAMYDLRGAGKFETFLSRVAAYITADYSARPLHHTHRTADEKRVLRNLRAKKARAKKKDSQ